MCFLLDLKVSWDGDWSDKAVDCWDAAAREALEYEPGSEVKIQSGRMWGTKCCGF